MCAELGIPIAEHKRDGPSTCIMFLGIEIDTIAGELRLPADKLHHLQALLHRWGDHKACERKELESLIGLLNHACKVVQAGRSFLHRMIDLLHSVPHSPHKRIPIWLNTGFRSDLLWWSTFVSHWNGISFLPTPSHLLMVEFATNASGTWGCGAWHRDLWFQIQWNSRSRDLPIAVKELIAIILACMVWGRSWRGLQVHCHCSGGGMPAI